MLMVNQLIGFGAFASAPPVTTLIPGGTGTVITDALSTWATPSNAFDATTSQTEANSAAANGHGGAPVGTNYVGKDWGAGNSKKITKIVLYGPSNNGLLRGGGLSVTASFDGSNDGSSWTVLDGAIACNGTNAQVITRTSANIDTSAAYRFHRISAPGNGAQGSAVAEFELYEDI